MGAHAGVNTVEDGLLFAYDMGPNPGVNKSWKGKPTVNTWYNDSYTYTNAATFSIVTDYPSTQSLPIEARGKKVIKLIADTPGTLGQCIPWRSGVDQVNGGTYNHSVWCYLESGSTVTVGQHWNPWDYGSSQYPPLGKWVRLNDPVTNSANNYGNIANAYRTDGVAYFTAPQYELGTDMSPFVHGTRSNTQSLLDWTGNNTITINGLTYNSDGTFSYYGTNGTGLSLPGTNFSLNAQTIECWCYASNFVQNGFMFEKTTNGTVNTQYSFFFNNNSSAHVYYRTYGLSPRDLTLSTSNSGVVNNQWNHMVATFDGSTKRIYVNGVQKTSANTTGTITANTTGAAYIGTYGNFAGYPFNGQIGVTKIYNKALTATEVQQNFEALRGRYGI